jgi:hypothetical protein
MHTGFESQPVILLIDLIWSVVRHRAWVLLGRAFAGFLWSEYSRPCSASLAPEGVLLGTAAVTSVMQVAKSSPAPAVALY